MLHFLFELAFQKRNVRAHRHVREGGCGLFGLLGGGLACLTRVVLACWEVSRGWLCFFTLVCADGALTRRGLGLEGARHHLMLVGGLERS